VRKRVRESPRLAAASRRGALISFGIQRSAPVLLIASYWQSFRFKLHFRSGKRRVIPRSASRCAGRKREPFQTPRNTHALFLPSVFFQLPGEYSCRARISRRERTDGRTFPRKSIASWRAATLAPRTYSLLLSGIVYF